MTLAIGLRTDSRTLFVALSIQRYQFDPVLLALVAALAMAVAGLLTTGLLLMATSSTVAYLPTFIGAFWALWRAVELLIQEVQR